MNIYTKKIMGFFNKLIKQRLFVFSLIVLFLFLIVLNRVFKLQIIEGEQLEKEFTLSILKERELEGQRGKIFDRYGYPLAENIIAYNVLLDGSIRVENMNKMISELCTLIKKGGSEMVKELPIGEDEDGNLIYIREEKEILKFKKQVFRGSVSGKLSDSEAKLNAHEMYNYLKDELFEISEKEFSRQQILDILNVRYPLWLNRYTQYQLEPVAININKETLARLEENIYKFPGVSISEDPLRVYNDAKYFSHIIGYTGTIDETTYESLKPQGYKANDIVGKIGVEKEMEIYLRGIDGKQRVEVDNFGRTMKVLDTQEPAAGKDVYLTIDRKLQIASYNILEKSLADILSSTLTINGGNYKDKDDEVTLLRDVFSSLFKNSVISIQKLEAAEEGRQKNITNIFNSNYALILNDIKASLINESTLPNKDYIAYYRFIVERLNTEGYLASGCFELTAYTQLRNSEISFRRYLKECENAKLIEWDAYGGKGVNIPEKTNEIVQKNYSLLTSLKRMIYAELAKKDKFSYSDICVALVEQGVLPATEVQLNGLKSGSVGALGFIKEKISKLELKPQQVALDPCSGSVVVTDVKTGEVLAMVSYPSYDNNKLVNNFDNEYYINLLNDTSNPLFPMATQGKTAPGSTYKMVAGIAALEEKVIGPNEFFSCQGIFTKVSPAARCWIYAYGGSHGPLTVASALEVSCNYFYYEMGFRLSRGANGAYNDTSGVSTLNKYATKLGLGTKTGIEIGDADPSLPERDAVRSSIGQTNNSYTPVQMARYVSTIANKGSCYELSVIDKVLERDGTLFYDKKPVLSWENSFNPINIEQIQKGMSLVTSGSRGTARTVFAGFPIAVSGKTGTAQQSLTRPDHGIFVGYAPSDKPEIGVAVTIPFGYGSLVPTKVGKEVVGSYYNVSLEQQTTTPIGRLAD